MKNRFIKITVFGLIGLLISSTVIFGAPKKADAFGAFGFSVSYEDIAGPLKNAASITLMALNRAFVSSFLQKIQQNYKINNYLNYVANVSDKVYVADKLANENPKEVYKIKKIIEKLRGQSTADTDAELQQIYNQEAAKNEQVKKLMTQGALTQEDINRQQAADFLINLNKATNTLNSTSIGQRVLANDTARVVVADANAAAILAMQSPGYKASYTCPTYPSDTDTIAKNNSLIQCVVRDPQDYVVSQIDSKIQGLFGEQLKPNDTVSGFLSIIAQQLSNKISNKLFHTDNQTNLIDDVNTGTINSNH